MSEARPTTTPGAPATAGGFPRPGHNHAPCQVEAMQRAESAFAARAMRLTDLRRRVLAEISGSHRAVGAYDVQQSLAAKGIRLAPISIYRALDALVAAGIVHRLESRNAYFACLGAHDPAATPMVLTCDKCGLVAEMAADGVRAAILASTARQGFAVRSALVEVTGLCTHCR